MTSKREEEYSRKFGGLRMFPLYQFEKPLTKLKDTYSRLLEVFSWLKKLPPPPHDKAEVIISSVCEARTKKGPKGQILQWTVDHYFRWGLIIDSGMPIETLAAIVIDTALAEYEEEWGDE